MTKKEAKTLKEKILKHFTMRVEEYDEIFHYIDSLVSKDKVKCLLLKKLLEEKYRDISV